MATGTAMFLTAATVAVAVVAALWGRRLLSWLRRPASNTVGSRIANDLLLAVTVGAVVTAGSLSAQKHIDDDRLTDSQRMQNLQFVRGRVSASPATDSGAMNPFQGIDLEGQYLSGLTLPRSDFSDARLSGAILNEARLRGSEFTAANLSGAALLLTDLSDTRLVDADLRDATLVYTNLRGADLTEARLDSQPTARTQFHSYDTTFTDGDLLSLDHVCYDDATRWPVGFTPPRPADCTGWP